MSENGHERGEWVFLPDAARRLGLAPQTIRRKLKRGELESRQVPTRTGPAYQVRLAGDQPLPDLGGDAHDLGHRHRATGDSRPQRLTLE